MAATERTPAKIDYKRAEKLRKPKLGHGKPTEFWSPNFLGRLYRSAISGAFDLLSLDGTDLRAQPLTERRKLLAKLLRKAPNNIRFSEDWQHPD